MPYKLLKLIVIVMCLSWNLTCYASLDEEFRGVPWGIPSNAAKSYGLNFEGISKTIAQKTDENLSFGNIKLSGVNYIFRNEIFREALMSISRLHTDMYNREKIIYAELVKQLGKPIDINKHTEYIYLRGATIKRFFWRIGDTIVTYSDSGIHIIYLNAKQIETLREHREKNEKIKQSSGGTF